MTNIDDRFRNEIASRRGAIFVGLGALVAASGVAGGVKSADAKRRKRRKTRNSSSATSIGVGGPGGNGGAGGNACYPNPCPDED